MEHDYIPQFPPPPYSESDTGTLSGAIPQARNPLGSPSSSVDETIYTPSYSPTASVHRSQTLGDDFDLASSSAAAYFESRPPPRTPVSGTLEIHRIAITATTAPKDLKYSPAFLAKDCTAQDWATFVNYLLPDHAAEANNDVVDRKLRAELVEGMHQLGLNQSERPRSDGSEINAQLLHLRQQISNTTERSEMVEPTILEWNRGFFRPRKILISTVDQVAERAAREETGRSSYSYIPPGEEMRQESSRNNRQGFLGLGGFPFIDAGPQGFRMGPIVANNEGFRIGKSLVANNEGLRLGNILVSDQHGFRLGGLRGFVKDRNGASPCGKPFGRRESDDDHARGWGHHGRRHGHHGGQSFSHGQHRRDRSSSASSSPSSSSSDSDSSVGSLLEHDDLSDQQLPIIKQSLMEWLNHPEQPITREFVQNVRRDIKAAKRQPSSPQLPDQDLKRMRSEVKDLLKSMKENRKTRKRQRKATRRERRASRRLEKKERQAARREVRRGGKMAERHCDGGGRGPPWMAVPRSFMANQPPLQTPANTVLPPAPPILAPATPGIPLARAASVPSVQSPSFGFGFGFGRPGRPGMKAMHGGWPFTQALPYAPGRICVPNGMTHPAPISYSAEKIHAQALQMEQAAKSKDSRAMELRTAATVRGVGERQRLKDLDLATKLEEEAENLRIEAEKLRAETQHLDTELARELEEDGGQASGIVRN